MAEFKLIAITLPEKIEGESDFIIRMLAAGIERVHIRKPEAEIEYVESIIEKIPLEWHARISLHDHFELTRIYKVGVHTNKRNPFPPDGVGIVSHSCHTISEAKACQKCSYVTLSPIFDSISKKGYRANDSLIQDFAVTDIHALPPVVALGGVDFNNLAVLKDLGFAGAAMLGQIWLADPCSVIEKIKNHVAIYN